MKSRSRILAIVALPLFFAGLAASLLFWRLSDKYLWQDEAQTAVLAERMLRFGRPLAYDGVNLITADHFAADDPATIDQRTGDPKAAIAYYVSRGVMQPDTTWEWHPWGQFVVEAISLKLLGTTTLAARLPFALAGVLTVVLAYWFVLCNFSRTSMASLTALFLTCNAYWVLHCRQCRYYSLSSLFLVLTLMGYARWQRHGRWGAVAFVVAASCWFQVDYGTLWPVLLVLFCDAFWARRHTLSQVVMVGAVLAAALAPFVYYFQLWHRASNPARPWDVRFLVNLLNLNEYVAPLLILLLAIVLLRRQWQELSVTERHLVTVACATLIAFTLWVPLAAPTPFLRYVIIVAPLGCFLCAWVLVRGLGSRSALVWVATAVVVLTPWPSWLLPAPRWYSSGTVLRPELTILGRELFAHRPDPNRIVIEWLKQNAAPSEEILINYEDLPLMFYLPNPIRGGLAAFRVEDDANSSPEFVVLRRSIDYVHWEVYRREMQRYRWCEVPLQAPDISWGNNPDPSAQGQNPATVPAIYVARRIRKQACSDVPVVGAADVNRDAADRADHTVSVGPK